MTFKTSFNEKSLLTFKIAVLSYARENLVLFLATNGLFVLFLLTSTAFPQLKMADQSSTIIATVIVLNIFFLAFKPLQIAVMIGLKKECEYFDFEYRDGLVSLCLKNKNVSGTFPEILSIEEYREYVEFRLTKSFKIAVPRVNFPKQEYRDFLVKLGQK